MESKAKLAGHSVHPMLVVFPLGLLATAVIFDVITLASNNGKFSEAAFYMIGAGIHRRRGRRHLRSHRLDGHPV
jgi:uncharacterized membrane protein